MAIELGPMTPIRVKGYLPCFLVTGKPRRTGTVSKYLVQFEDGSRLWMPAHKVQVRLWANLEYLQLGGGLQHGEQG